MSSETSKTTEPLIWQDSGGAWVVSADDYRNLEEQLEASRRKVEAYDRARAKVKIEGATRAEYVLRAEAAEEQLEVKQKALTAALDVAIWLSALIGNPDGAADPQAAETWQNEMRPRLFAALNESNPADVSERATALEPPATGAGREERVGSNAHVASRSETSDPAKNPKEDA